MDNPTPQLTQVLILPKGIVRQATPKLVWQNKVYAYQVDIEIGRIGLLPVDARQLPVDVTQLQGQYGEVGLYATAVNSVVTTSGPATSGSAQYLGEQLSLVFFQDLLNRYNAQLAAAAKPPAQQDEDDGIPQFQDDYAQTLEDYTPNGFFMGDYESAPMLRFPWGTVLLTPTTHEQVQAVAKPGQWLEVMVSEWSLACFKLLAYPN